MARVPEVMDYAPGGQPLAAGGRFRALFNGRGIWALSDQAMLSIGNFFTNILLIRHLSKDNFGNFAVLFSVILFLNNLHTSIVTYPLSVLSAGEDDAALRRQSFAFGINAATGLIFVDFAGGYASAHVQLVP